MMNASKHTLDPERSLSMTHKLVRHLSMFLEILHGHAWRLWRRTLGEFNVINESHTVCYRPLTVVPPCNV